MHTYTLVESQFFFLVGMIFFIVADDDEHGVYSIPYTQRKIVLKLWRKMACGEGLMRFSHIGDNEKWLIGIHIEIIACF